MNKKIIISIFILITFFSSIYSISVDNPNPNENSNVQVACQSNAPVGTKSIKVKIEENECIWSWSKFRYICNAGPAGTKTVKCYVDEDISYTRTSSGTTTSINSQKQSTPINGQCGASVNICSSGALQDDGDTATEYKWTCIGSNGGSNAACSITKVSCAGTCRTSCNNGEYYDATQSCSTGICCKQCGGVKICGTTYYCGVDNDKVCPSTYGANCDNDVSCNDHTNNC